MRSEEIKSNCMFWLSDIENVKKIEALLCNIWSRQNVSTQSPNLFGTYQDLEIVIFVQENKSVICLQQKSQKCAVPC